jgi:hypothetical protein
MTPYTTILRQKKSRVIDIGIPNGPVKDSTRGLLKAHYLKNKKIRKPKMLLRKARIVIRKGYL